MKNKKGSLANESKWCGWPKRPNHSVGGGLRTNAKKDGGVIPLNKTAITIFASGCNSQSATKWSVNSGPLINSNNGGGPNGTNASLSNLGAGNYRAKCVQNGCEGAFTEINLTKAGCNPIPSISNITSDRGFVLQANLTTNLNASGCAGYTVKWSKDGGPLINSDSFNNGVANLNSQTAGKFRAKCFDNFGCEGAFSTEIEVKRFACSDLNFNTNLNNTSTIFLEGSTVSIKGLITSQPWISPAYVLQTDFRFVWEKVSPVIDYGDFWRLTIQNAALTNAGQYRLKAKMLNPATGALLSPELNCYSNPISVQITPKLDCDNLYIKSTTAANVETTKLTRANGTYENLTLSPANFDGSPINANLSYVWTGPGLSTPSGGWGANITINKVGEYTVNISNGFQQCSQKISISGTACDPISTPNFCLGQPMIAPPLGVGGLPHLAVGDIITAGNFEFTVTQVGLPGSPPLGAGGLFSGKATMNIINGPGHLKAGLKTEFAGISINECYQVTAVPAQNLTTYFRSEYDPSWGNIMDLSTKTPKPAEAGEEINGLIAINEKIDDEINSKGLSTNCAQRERLVQYLADLNAIMAQINASADYTATEKTDIANSQNAVTSVLNSLVGVGGCLAACDPNGRVAAPAGVNCATEIDVKTTNDYLIIKNEENFTNKYAGKTVKAIIFSNGYRPNDGLIKVINTGLEDKDSENIAHISDFNSYWKGVDKLFINRRGNPIFKYYIDGHHSLLTSNHNNSIIDATKNESVLKSIENFGLDMLASENAKTKKFTNSLGPGDVPQMNSCFENEDCVTLNEKPNNIGFNTRYKNGKKAATDFFKQLSTDFNNKLKELNVKFEIDVVAHSMGFAYAQGFIKQVNDLITPLGLRSDFVDWSGYYIIAPENGCGGVINASDNWEQIYQYGSNLGQSNADKKWLQDGVAPQCAVIGIGNNRVFIPTYYSDGKTKIPKGFVESHSISNYGWIFEIQPGQGLNNKGYVTQK